MRSVGKESKGDKCVPSVAPSKLCQVCYHLTHRLIRVANPIKKRITQLRIFQDLLSSKRTLTYCAIRGCQCFVWNVRLQPRILPNLLIHLASNFFLLFVSAQIEVSSKKSFEKSRRLKTGLLAQTNIK